MSHFARIENGIVTDVIAAEQDFIDMLPKDQVWIQTSYNTYGNAHPNGTPLRGNFAGIGFVYDQDNDVFYCPQPYPSWTLNSKVWGWEPPVQYPLDGNRYTWDEQNLTWKQLG